MSELKKNVGTPMLSIYGAGTILGAGIYVLIGEIAGAAGWWLPLAFLCAAAAAGVNGLVYAELSTRSPSAGGPSDYVQKAFDWRWLTVLVGWMIVATGVVSAATIANGFAGYLGQFVDWPAWIVKLGLLALLGGVAAAGVRESAWFMAITTSLGLLGLLWIMYLGYFDAGGGEGWQNFTGELPSLADTAVLTGVLSATFLAVYAFIGFEDIVHVAEETKDPQRSIPIAIVFALALSAVLYVGVSIAALMVVSPQQLADSDAPLVVVNQAAGYPDWPLVTLSLWIIMNGALAQIIMATRVLYSMGQNDAAPEFLSRINEKTNTPLIGTLVVTAVIIGLAIGFPLKTLASATSLIMLLIFTASNAALIVLEKREPDAPFDVPRFVPWLGLLVCAVLIIGNFTVGGGH